MAPERKADPTAIQAALDGPSHHRSQAEWQDMYRELAAELKAEQEAHAEQIELACENPPSGCECPGCSLARERYG